MLLSYKFPLLIEFCSSSHLPLQCSDCQLIQLIVSKWFFWQKSNPLDERAAQQTLLYPHLHAPNQTDIGRTPTCWGSSCLITTGNDPEFNVPFAFTKTKLPKELKTTWICLALCLKLFFPWQPVQPGLSQTTGHGHCLQAVWNSNTKFWSYTKPSMEYLLPPVSHLFQMFHSHLP